MKIAGVDVGKRRLAIATFLLDGQGRLSLLSALSLYVHPSLRGQELNKLREMFSNLGEGMGWNYVFVEEPPLGRGVKASMDLSQTAGTVLAEAARLGAHAELVNVKVWKKQIVGNGNASKQDVAMFLERSYPSYADQCGPDQDAIDATCIGLFGVQSIRLSEDLAVGGFAFEDFPGA